MAPRGPARGFLADLGIGTIDQTLLAVLPVNFQALRLAGLADKDLIVEMIVKQKLSVA